MACHVETPIQLNITFPENGCQKDFTIYSHPEDGQQRSAISCDWDERIKEYDCFSGEPGVTWRFADSGHAIVKFPPEHLRYEISCLGRLESRKCIWSLDDETLTDHTEVADPCKSYTEFPVGSFFDRDTFQHGNNEIIGVGVMVAVLTVGLLLTAVYIIFLKRKIKNLKQSLENAMTNGSGLLNTETLTSTPVTMLSVSDDDLCSVPQGVYHSDDASIQLASHTETLLSRQVSEQSLT